MKNIISLNRPKMRKNGKIEVFIKRGKFYFCMWDGKAVSQSRSLAGAWNKRPVENSMEKAAL